MSFFLFVLIVETSMAKAAVSVPLYPGSSYEFIEVMNKIGSNANIDFQVTNSGFSKWGYYAVVNFGGGNNNNVHISEQNNGYVDYADIYFSISHSDEDAYARTLRHGCNAFSVTLLTAGLNEDELKYIYTKVMNDYVEHIPQINDGKPLKDRSCNVYCKKYKHHVVVGYDMSIKGIRFIIHAMK